MLFTSSKTGFTLVETLVAITILIIGVLGPLALAVRGITDGLFISNELAANYLAQEAMETVAGMRGLNVASGLAWDANLSSLNCNVPAVRQDQLLDPSLDGAACTIDLDQLTVVHDLSHPARLAYDGSFSRNQYWYAEQVDPVDQVGPVFRRRVYLIPDPSGSPNAPLKVVVGIAWYNKDTPRTLVVTNYLYPR